MTPSEKLHQMTEFAVRNYPANRELYLQVENYIKENFHLDEEELFSRDNYNLYVQLRVLVAEAITSGVAVVDYPNRYEANHDEDIWYELERQGLRDEGADLLGSIMGRVEDCIVNHLI